MTAPSPERSPSDRPTPSRFAELIGPAAMALGGMLLVLIVNWMTTGPATDPAPAPAPASAIAPVPSTPAMGYSAPSADTRTGVVPNLIGKTGNEISDWHDESPFNGLNFTVNYAAMTQRAISQSPAPGTTVPITESISVTLDPSVQGSSTTGSELEAPAAQPPAPSSTEWTYKISGAKRGSITYSTEGAGVEQDTDAKLPWTKKVDSPTYGGGMPFAYVSAQNAGSGTITCQILDPSGTVVAENSSRGAYAIVTCQG